MSLLEETAAPESVLADAERLAQLEAVIATGLDTYVRIGRALEEIKTRRLYLLSHETFREYLADRWGLSQARGFSLCYSAAVADALEAAGERPAGAESALREFAPILHSAGPAATVEAYRGVVAEQPDRALPSAARTRSALAASGLVDVPERSAADAFQRRLRSLEQLLPKCEPHRKLSHLYAEYAARLHHAGNQLEVLATGDLDLDDAPPLPAHELCPSHGVRRRADGLCAACRRPDLPARRSG